MRALFRAFGRGVLKVSAVALVLQLIVLAALGWNFFMMYRDGAFWSYLDGGWADILPLGGIMLVGLYLLFGAWASLAATTVFSAVAISPLAVNALLAPNALPYVSAHTQTLIATTLLCWSVALLVQMSLMASVQHLRKGLPTPTPLDGVWEWCSNFLRQEDPYQPYQADDEPAQQ